MVKVKVMVMMKVIIKVKVKVKVMGMDLGTKIMCHENLVRIGITGPSE